MRRVFSLLVIGALITCCAAKRRAAVPTEMIAPHAHAITGADTDYDVLLRAIGSAQLVLLGEATHGTHEFYAERARITQRLVREKKFTALALEADWADAARVDRYVRGLGNDRTAVEALGGFTRFPRWMWRNEEFAALVEWLRRHNDALPPTELKVGVYGLDLYGLADSARAVPEHLREIDAAAAAEAARRYGCFSERQLEEPERYGADVAQRPSRSCEAAVREQFESIRRRYDAADPRDQRALDALFSALQNARVVGNAEAYYRESFAARVSTWNLRDRHMVDTMHALQNYLIRRNGHDNIVVWAHNSHVGDARATSSGQFGEWNIGQLVREGWPRATSFSVGFTTYSGTVFAARNWGEAGQRRNLHAAMRGSHADILHGVTIPAYYLILADVQAEFARTARLQRAVGVIYRPETEYQSHYFTATLREQFDAVIHIDRTEAVRPLDR